MSIFIPYAPSDVLTYLATLFNLEFTDLTGYQTAILTIGANIYFFVFWSIIVYFALKIFNRVWERFF